MTILARRQGLYAAGLGFLALAWAKNRLHGYTTPNAVARGDIAGAVEYVQDTVSSWQRFLDGVAEIRGRDVLELGPGSSLGTGALLLALGANSYHAVDAFELADRHDREFLAAVLGDPDPQVFADADVTRARAIVAAGESVDFSYAVDRRFDIRELAAGRRFDLMLSCAAFEHYDDIEATIAQMSAVARPGCVAAHIVDFQTHSRWIREADPNNIYRYSDALYRLFSFPGQPNRKRPADYVAAFERNGWINVRVVGDHAAGPALMTLSTTGLAKAFNRPGAEMSMLSGVVLAERA